MSGNEKKDEEKESHEIKEISITPVLTDLFKPTAKYLGKELKEYVKSKVEGFKKTRQEENFINHLKSVQEELDRAPPLSKEQLTVERLEVFQEWSEHVQDIDPSHEELSGLWNGLLAAAARGEEVSTDALNALQMLTPSEAVLLLNICDTPRFWYANHQDTKEGRRKAFYAKSLAQKGLVDHGINPFRAWSLIVSLAGMFLTGAFLPESKYPNSAVKLAMVVGTIMAASLFAYAALNRWRATWLGEKVASYALKKRRSSSGAQGSAKAPS